MSVNVPDVAAFYFQYKLTVYDNLFVGIVYGEEQATSHCYSSLLTHIIQASISYSTLPRSTFSCEINLGF